MSSDPDNHLAVIFCPKYEEQYLTDEPLIHRYFDVERSCDLLSTVTVDAPTRFTETRRVSSWTDEVDCSGNATTALADESDYRSDTDAASDCSSVFDPQTMSYRHHANEAGLGDVIRGKLELTATHKPIVKGATDEERTDLLFWFVDTDFDAAHYLDMMQSVCNVALSDGKLDLNDANEVEPSEMIMAVVEYVDKWQSLGTVLVKFNLEGRFVPDP